MASVPSAQRPGLGRGGRPRQRRGQVESYGQGRTCATAGCPTQLSRYNKDDLCRTHAAELAANQRSARP